MQCGAEDGMGETRVVCGVLVIAGVECWNGGQWTVDRQSVMVAAAVWKVGKVGVEGRSR